MRADTKVSPYKNSLTLALTQRERGFGGGSQRLAQLKSGRIGLIKS